MCLLFVQSDGADNMSIGYVVAGCYLNFVNKENGVCAIWDAGDDTLG